MQRMHVQQHLWHIIHLMIQKPVYVLTLVYYRCLKPHATSGNYFPFVWYSWPNYSALLHSVVVESRNVDHAGQEAFWNEWSVADPLCRHRPFDSVSVVSCPPLFAVFVWCYFSRKRQTPLSSGSAVLLRAIHACCRVHRVKHNKGRPLFTSGTNHPDGTSINPPPCRQWLECTYVWPWTIQMRQRQIEWGCTEAIFSLARWPVSCSRLLSPPHLLLMMCQQLGKCLSFTC